MRTVGEVRRVSSPVESEVRDARVKLLFALVVAGVVVAVPVVFTELFVDTPELVAAVGLVYALACTGLWAVTQTTASGFPSGTRVEPLNTVFVLLVGEVVLSLQTAIPTYAFVTWGLVAPLVGLVVATTLTVLFFSQPGVESDPFGMHALLFGPILLGGTVVLGLVEFGAQTLVG